MRWVIGSAMLLAVVTVFAAREGLARDGLARDGLAREGLARDGLARDGLLVTSGLVSVGSVGWPFPVGRSDARIEAQGPNALVDVFDTTFPGGLQSEAAYVWSAYDSSGQIKKQASISTMWADPDPAHGFAVLRINPSADGGDSNPVDLRIFGSHGVQFFGPGVRQGGDRVYPGEDVLAVRGIIRLQQGGPVPGLLQLAPSADRLAQPVCEAAARGAVWHVAGGAGEADRVEVCVKTAAERYEWLGLL